MDLGRRQGRVSTEDFRRLLPLAGMSAEEIANLVLRLEERGIAVDLDPSLFVPAGGKRHEGPPAPAEGVALKPEPPSPPAPGTPASEMPPRAAKAPSPPPVVPAPAPGRSRTLWVVASTVIAVALLVLLSFAMG